MLQFYTDLTEVQHLNTDSSGNLFIENIEGSVLLPNDEDHDREGIVKLINIIIFKTLKS